MGRSAERKLREIEPGTLACLEREPLSDDVRGFVVAHSEDFCLLEVFGPDLRLDGYETVRYRDVSKCKSPGRRGRVLEAALESGWTERRGPPEGLDLGSLRALIRTAGLAHRVVTIHREHVSEDGCWIGAVEKVGTKRLRLRLLEPGAVWDPEPMSFDLAEVTRVGFGSAYETALLHVLDHRERSSASGDA